MIKRFDVPGEPKGKQRPRVTMRGGYATTYTPKETVSYENLVKMCFVRQCGREMLEGPVSAKIVAYYSIPQSASKKKHKQMLTGEIKNIKKPDCDNLAKIILDSLNGIAYHDDSQVCELSVQKLYGDIPEVLVELQTIDENQGSNKANKETTK